MLAVKDSWTYRSVVPAGRLTDTVFPVDGLNVYVAEPTRVVQVLSFVLPRIESVWVRVPHALDGGRSRVTEPRVWDEPRSTVSVVGHAPFVPSQYVLVLPSFAFDATYVWVLLLAVIDLPCARFGFGALELVPQTWNSEACAPFCTLLAVKLNSTYWSVVPAGRFTVTVFPVAGLNV